MKKHHAARQGGFTLIELMIVIAIVGILAAIALPAYQDYTVRARMSEPMAKLAEAKTSIAEFFAATGGIPQSLNQAGIEAADANVRTEIINRITYDSASLILGIEVHGSVLPDSGDAGFELVGVSNTNNRTITWTCQPATNVFTAAATKYLPANCRG